MRWEDRIEQLFVAAASLWVIFMIVLAAVVLQAVYWRAEDTEGGGILRAAQATCMHGTATHPYQKLHTEKQELYGSAGGVVLDVGCGTGIDWGYIRADSVTKVLALEPNVHLHAAIQENADLYFGEADVTVEMVGGVGQEMRLPDNSVDTVVAVKVLCTVNGMDKVLSEVLRVLKPGGRFLFLEHTADPESQSWTRVVQHFIMPLWKAIGLGCQPDHETWKAIERAGFETVELSHFEISSPSLLWFIRPHIMGVAVK